MIIDYRKHYVDYKSRQIAMQRHLCEYLVICELQRIRIQNHALCIYYSIA